MTDNDMPGSADTSATPASGNAGANAPAGNAQPFGSFGPARGAGLARGKRTSTPAASAASASPADYKPTALEIIVPQREYKNPFGSTEVPDPSPEATAAAAREEAAPTKSVPVADVPELPAPTFTPVRASASAPAPVSEPKDEEPSLTILPPAEAKRPAVSWDRPSGSQPQSSGQPYAQRPRREEFRRDGPRHERRDGRPDQRQPADPRDQPREHYSREQRQPGDPRDQRPREHYPREQRGEFKVTRREPAAPAAKSGGLFGWLKRLFGGKTEALPSQAPAPSREGEHPYPRRRRRGGRGRNFGERSSQPREPGSSGPSQFQGGPGGPGGDAHGHGGHPGGGRRRSRGGRGRYRGDGDPRPEGQQGGGAI